MFAERKIPTLQVLLTLKGAPVDPFLKIKLSLQAPRLGTKHAGKDFSSL